VKVIVTGGCGFFGFHICTLFRAQGAEVVAYDNLAKHEFVRNPYMLEAARDYNRRELERLGIRIAGENVRDKDTLIAYTRDADYLCHTAAQPAMTISWEDPELDFSTNTRGTFNVLEGARLAGVKRVVYAASSSAYGNQPGFPRVETMSPQPLSPYAVQKLTGELYMQAYWRVYGLETVCLRYFNIFGARQVPDSPYSGVMARFILMMMRGDRPTIFGDGEQGRDFTHVENVVQANLLALHATATSVAGRVFNIACGQRHTLNETFRLLATLLRFKHPPIYGPEREGDVRDSLADISAAREALGYIPQVGFEEGLRRTVAWYCEEFAVAE